MKRLDNSIDRRRMSNASADAQARWATVPREYNAADHFIERHRREGRADKIAYIDDRDSYSYGELAERVNRAGNALRGLGVGRDQRIVLCMLDGIDFVARFWGAVKIGEIPVPVNSLLPATDYDFMLLDSRATVLAVSASLLS